MKHSAAAARHTAQRGRLACQVVTALGMVAAGLAVTAAGVTGLALSPSGRPAARPAPSHVPVPSGVAAAILWPSAGTHIALPVSLTIPAIGVRTSLVHLGLTTAGALQVPTSFHVAGWYDRSPRPGAPGPAIIAGHIDNLAGPAVFYRLSSMRPGDRVYVRRADGTLAVFTVTSVRSYLKDRFPTQAVYGPAPGSQLRLISCGGAFDPARGSYLSNIVVDAIAAPS